MVYFTTKREGYREYKSREYLCKTYPTRRMCTENAKCEKTVLRHVWQDYVEMAEHVRYMRPAVCCGRTIRPSPVTGNCSG